MGFQDVFNIGINCLVLPRYGYLGASWNTVISEVLLSVYFFCYLQSSFVRLSLIGTAFRLGISGGLMGLPLWGLKTWPSAVVWPLAGVCYVIGLVLFRLVTREDWLLLKRLLTGLLSKLEVEL